MRKTNAPLAPLWKAVPKSLATVLALASLSACVAYNGPALPANASNTAAATQAQAFAQNTCADCHAIEPLDLSPNPDAPTFASIVNRKGLTKASLSKWLVNAHNYPAVMEFDLSPAQADMIAQHMLTLKDPNYVPDS